MTSKQKDNNGKRFAYACGDIIESESIGTVIFANKSRKDLKKDGFQLVIASFKSNEDAVKIIQDAIKYFNDHEDAQLIIGSYGTKTKAEEEVIRSNRMTKIVKEIKEASQNVQATFYTCKGERTPLNDICENNFHQPNCVQLVHIKHKRNDLSA